MEGCLNKKFLRILKIAIALVGLLVGYIFIVGQSALDPPAAARSATGPDKPHILYLAPEGKQRGLVNDQKAQSLGATPVRDWVSVREVAGSKPLDALLIDAAMFGIITVEDMTWLQAQFRQGVVVVSLGLEDDKLAQTLGLKTLQTPGEAHIPIGPTGYRLVNSYVFGHSEDIKKLEDSDWINRGIGQDTDTSPDIKYPMVSSFRSARGELNSNDDLGLLQLRLQSEIADVEQNRQQMQQDSGEK